MRARLSLFIALVVLASARPAGQAPAAPQRRTAPILPGDSSIAGRVVDRATELPLSGVLVTLASVDRVRALVAYTDDAGRYEFTYIAAGDYRVTASHPNYVTTEFGLQEGRTAVSSRVAVVQLDRQVAKTNVTFSLARGATITGRVTRNDGQPLKEARVIALLQSDDGSAFSAPPNSWTRTDARGEYVLSNLAEGPYQITAMWSEGDPRSSRTAGPRSVYHPGTIRAQELVAVPVSAGATAKDIDIVFPAAELLRISGKVVHSGAEGHLEAFLMNDQGTQPISVAPDGTFTTPHIRGGRYTVVARTTSGDVLEAASISVDLSFDISELVLGLMPTGAIAGRVVTDDGTPVSDEMQVAAVLVDEGKEVDEHRRDRSQIGPSGEFEVRGVFGQRIMRMVGVTAGWKIARVTRGKDDVTTLSIAPGVTVDDVLIVLTRA
jgi:hypothetical protein